MQEEQSGSPERGMMGSGGLWKAPSSRGAENGCQSAEAIVMSGATGSRRGWGLGEGRWGNRGVLPGGALSCHRVGYGAAWYQEKRIRGLALAPTAPLPPFRHYPKALQLPFTEDFRTDI